MQLFILQLETPQLGHPSIRDTFFFEVLQLEILSLRDPSIRDTLILKITAPKAIIKEFFIDHSFYHLFFCRRHPISFYDVNEDVILHQCGPFHRQYCNFHDFLTVGGLLVFPTVSGLAFPIFAPRLSPLSFSLKIYKWHSGESYCSPARSLRRLHC
jgi:hypothetical protein